MPLSHLRVLDFTRVRSGPTCTKILADFGGEVIRIERPGEPDREREPFDAVDLHRGKKSVLLDLAKPTGHPVHGPMRVLGLPVLLHRTPARVTAPFPLPGQHTREILRAAGYAAAAIDPLLAEGVAAESRPQ